jgi:hypothetical protein
MTRGTAFCRPALNRIKDATRRLTDKQAIAFETHFAPLKNCACKTLRFPEAAHGILQTAIVPANEIELAGPEE